MTDIRTELIDEILFISVTGEVDAGTSLKLDNAFKEVDQQQVKKVAVDLTALDYISSAGLGVFISHIDEFESHGIKLVFYGINDTVKEVFEILGLEKLLSISVDKKGAIEVLNEG